MGAQPRGCEGHPKLQWQPVGLPAALSTFPSVPLFPILSFLRILFLVHHWPCPWCLSPHYVPGLKLYPRVKNLNFQKDIAAVFAAFKDQLKRLGSQSSPIPTPI